MSVGRAGPDPRALRGEGTAPSPHSPLCHRADPDPKVEKAFWPQKVVCSFLVTSLLTMSWPGLQTPI